MINNKDFEYNSFTIGQLTFDFKQASARGGKLYPRLYLPLKLNLNKIDKSYIVEERVPKLAINSLNAGLFVENEQEKLSDSLPIFKDTIFHRNRTNSTVFELEFPLDYNKINLLEIKRGNDINLKLALQFQFGIFEPINVIVDSQLTTEKKYFITGYQTYFSDFNIEIPQSHWLKNVLPNLEVGEFFVIELPKGDIKLKKAWEYIETAEHAYRNWDSKGVFANCRELGEFLNDKIKNKFGESSFTYSERWQRRFKNYSYFASLDLHLEEKKSKPNTYAPDEVKTYKTDAENMILSAKVITKYAQALLSE